MAQHLISVPDDTAGVATAEDMAATDVGDEQLQVQGLELRPLLAG